MRGDDSDKPNARTVICGNGEMNLRAWEKASMTSPQTGVRMFSKLKCKFSHIDRCDWAEHKIESEFKRTWNSFLTKNLLTRCPPTAGATASTAAAAEFESRWNNFCSRIACFECHNLKMKNHFKENLREQKAVKTVVSTNTWCDHDEALKMEKETRSLGKKQ